MGPWLEVVVRGCPLSSPFPTRAEVLPDAFRGGPSASTASAAAPGPGQQGACRHRRRARGGRRR